MKVRLSWFMLIVMLLTLGLAACNNDDEGSSDNNDNQELPGEGDYLGVLTEPPVAIENFSGPSTKGTDFNLVDYRGKVVLVYFGFGNCPDLCPTTLAEMRRVVTDLGEDANRVQVVWVTIDPERDTLDTMKTHAEAFHPDFIGVRVEGEALTQLQDSFGVIAARQENTDSALGYTFDHTASVFVIDTQGRWFERFLYGTAASTVVNDVRLLLAEENS